LLLQKRSPRRRREEEEVVVVVLVVQSLKLHLLEKVLCYIFYSLCDIQSIMCIQSTCI
uniref:Uncharacterized protein n=1 Tax=Amphimedon queenslandica TaxID=400682 RepID=A0A1X7SEW7_AMPQE